MLSTQKFKKLENAPRKGEAATGKNPSYNNIQEMDKSSSDEKVNKVEKWKRKHKNKKYKKSYKYKVTRNKNGTFKKGKRKKVQLIEFINETRNIITPPEFNIRINNQEIKAEIDSGATTSVMSTNTLKKIGLTPNKSSKAKLSSFNGKETYSIGKLQTTISINEIDIPISFEIFEQNKDKCLIGIDWLKENNGKIDVENEEITLKHNDKKCKVPIMIYQQMTKSEETEFETSEGEWSDGESNNDD